MYVYSVIAWASRVLVNVARPGPSSWMVRRWWLVFCHTQVRNWAWLGTRYVSSVSGSVIRFFCRILFFFLFYSFPVVSLSSVSIVCPPVMMMMLIARHDLFVVRVLGFAPPHAQGKNLLTHCTWKPRTPRGTHSQFLSLHEVSQASAFAWEGQVFPRLLMLIYQMKSFVLRKSIFGIKNTQTHNKERERERKRENRYLITFIHALRWWLNLHV